MAWYYTAGGISGSDWKAIAEAGKKLDSLPVPHRSKSDIEMLAELIDSPLTGDHDGRTSPNRPS